MYDENRFDYILKEKFGIEKKEWVQNGKLHRDDGPAVINANGVRGWFINGTKITNNVERWIKKNKITYPFTDAEKAMFFFAFG